ncbi:MAG: ABC transporter substrate-binding protein [Hydrogenophaga sp.]|nr:ABC transporter substrate-binding protein [Hydrogenophaga sp.]
MPILSRREVLGAAALATLGLGACSKPPLKIGFVGGLTGRTADLGVAGRDGALLALEQANAGGGVGGRQLELLTVDDQQNPAAAAAAFQRLREAGVAAIVGPMTSAMAMAMVPLANAAGLTLVSPTVTTSALTGLDDHFFRVISSTREYAQASARFHAQRSKLTRVAAVLDMSNAAYTERWLDDFEAEFRKLGGQVIAREGYTFQPGMGFADLAQRALAAQPEALLLLTGAVDAAQLMQQLRKLQPAMPVMTAEWAATEQLLELAGGAAEGVVAAQFLDRNNTSPSYQQFRQAYQQRFGNPSGFADLAAFDAMRVTLQALGAQQSGESLKQTLLRVRRFEGAQQVVAFDDSGDAVRQTFITVVRQGRYEVLT